MKEQLKNTSNIQDSFFSILKKSIPSQQSLVNILSDLLEVSQDSVYRRLRGEKKLDIEEMLKICKAFNLSIDTIFSLQSRGTVFHYTSLDVRDRVNYLTYMQDFSRSIELVKESKEKEIVISAIDIPVFHFLPFHELTLFKLFAWNNTTYNQNIKFDSFANDIGNQDIFSVYKKIATDYSQIPSTEVWTVNTIDTIIRLLDFYFETGYFEKKETPILLCNQLLQMIENIKKWVETGKKSESAVFKFYISDTDLENNFILLKTDDELKCIVKLFTINSIYTSDKGFCTETQNWLETSKKRSILLSGASERDRFRYFNVLQQKVKSLLDKFEKNTDFLDII